MRQMFITKDDFVFCESADGWSLHAPGSLDEDIASGDASALVSGHTWPRDEDYFAAIEQYAHWASEIIEVDGGWLAFESADDAATWHAQV